MKEKIIRVTVIAEFKITEDMYGGEFPSDETIIEQESEQWDEWILDHVKSEKVEVINR